MPRYIHILLLALLSQLVSAADDGNATRFFQGHLANCGTNEIRCVWFLNDSPGVGMLMTFNLSDYSVHTVRKVYDWAEQTAETRKLSHSQVLTLQRVTAQMPQSDKGVEFNKAVSVSFRRDGKVEVFQYDRRLAPSVVERLYDVGGGYLSTGKGPHAPHP